MYVETQNLTEFIFLHTNIFCKLDSLDFFQFALTIMYTHFQETSFLEGPLNGNSLMAVLILPLSGDFCSTCLHNGNSCHGESPFHNPHWVALQTKLAHFIAQKNLQQKHCESFFTKHKTRVWIWILCNQLCF